MRAKIGTTLCRSGRNGGVNCGVTRRLFWTEYDGRWTREVEMTGGGATGDSGGPIWNPRTQKAVGLVGPYANRPNPVGALNVMGLEFVKGDF